MITADELASVRADMQLLMPDSATISHRSGLTNTAQGFTTNYGTTASSVCRWAQLSGRELVQAAQVSTDATSVVTFPADTDIRNADLLNVITADGDEYELQVEYVVKRSKEFHRRVYCKDFNVSV